MQCVYQINDVPMLSVEDGVPYLVAVIPDDRRKRLQFFKVKHRFCEAGSYHRLERAGHGWPPSGKRAFPKPGGPAHVLPRGISCSNTAIPFRWCLS